ncbi:MAG TPA: molybdopterin-synthase adenylyltransferase MoeB [Sphingomonadales bacterium]|jgi:molybdopterin/thiamine biosynthesis adenylyltransferase
MAFTDEQLERYARHVVLREVGGPGQQALMRARVLVIGAGGLGSPVILYLAAAGVGTIGVVDDDAVSLSNLQRQVIHRTADIGRPKTESAKDAVAALNPDVAIVEHRVRLAADNAADLIAQYDIVADGCDNFTTRLIVNDVCVRLRKPLVSAALSQFEGQLATFKPYAGADLPCYRCFVPEPPQGIANCAEAGILGAVAGVMGTWQAVEVMKEIIGLGDGLAGKLLLFDALSARTRLVRLRRDPDCPACGNIRRD